MAAKKADSASSRTKTAAPKENDSIGSRIKAFAKARHGSVAALTDAIGKGRNFLGAYVSGRAKPGSLILSALADAGCNINWLLTGTGEMLRSAEPSVAFIGEIMAGLPRTMIDQAPSQVIAGVIESATFTIVTSDGKRILVVKTDK